MKRESTQPTLQRSHKRRWITYLWREWTIESWRPIAPAFARPDPHHWNNDAITAAWLGHSTVLINFFGTTIITDPVLFPRIGVRLAGFTIGPKRLTAPALTVRELPHIDLVLLSHAHFDHFDLRTLKHFDSSTRVITAPDTKDLLRRTRFGELIEARLQQGMTVETSSGPLDVMAVPVKHWGARMRKDVHRGYCGYVIKRRDRRVLFSGDTAYTDSFGSLPKGGPLDLAIMSIGCYNPWIRTHCTPEQAIEMADAAGARFIIPVHHQTFRLSFEPFREPIERFEAALRKNPERIALREIGQTFVVPD